MEVKIINAYVKSANNCMVSMANLTPKRLPPFLKNGTEPQFDVSASIGVTGSHTGAITINFDLATACDVASKMLGEEHKEVDESVLDAMGEIINIIAGAAKAEGLNYKISLPTISIGTGMSHRFTQNIKTIVIPFELETGSFYLEVCLRLD